MDVTAVIPVWNRRELLAGLFTGLRSQTFPLKEIVVVDNGSTDGAGEEAARLGARVVRLESNRGFASAVNRGIRECRTQLAAVVNNDVQLAPDWVEQLSRALTDAGVWFACGKVLSFWDHSRIDGTWDLLARSGCAWRAGHGQADRKEFSESRDIWSPPGTAAMFRVELFRKIGGFDEQFESYLEDVELGLRCALHRMRGRYVPQAIAWHRGSATLGRWHAETVRRISRNQVFLVRKHFPRRLTWPVLLGQVLWGGVALRHGQFPAWFRGKLQGVAVSVKRSPSGELTGILRSQEREIADLQHRSGFEKYWRVYFLLTSCGSK